MCVGNTGNKMNKIIVDGKEFAVSEEQYAAIMHDQKDQTPKVDHALELLLLSGGGYLNPNLVTQQKITKQDIARLQYLHWVKDEIMRQAHAAVKQIEFEMQKTWGFSQDETKHSHRLQIPNPIQFRTIDDVTSGVYTEHPDMKKTHASHTIRSSDASTFDEICTECGATDASGDNRLHYPCSGVVPAVIRHIWEAGKTPSTKKSVVSSVSDDKTVNLSITNCIKCPHHKIVHDPDPHDSFNFDDVAVVCTITDDDPKGIGGRYFNHSHIKKKAITIACRPYNVEKECNHIPTWCPLREKK